MLPHVDPQRWRTFTTAEFERLVECGILREGERVVLRGGRIVTMAAKGPLHEISVAEVARALEDAYGRDCLVRQSSPVWCSDHDLPEPDVSVVRGRPRDWRRHPRGDETLMVVEVAVSSLQDDLGAVSMYAAAAVPCLWIVDVAGRRVLVHTRPEGGAYTHVDAIAEDGIATPPGTRAALTVRDLLP